jgi:hypothetical protein
MYLSKITDYDISNLSANNPAAGAVDMWVTGQFQLSTYPSAHKYYGDIFAEQLGVTLSLTYDSSLGHCSNSKCKTDQGEKEQNGTA